MSVKHRFLVLLLFLCVFVSSAFGETRALLIACHDFLHLPSLGDAVSGNLTMLSETMQHAGLPDKNIRIEDGTIGDIPKLQQCISNAFHSSNDGDLSIIYICTHGFDENNGHLLLSDGRHEEALTGPALFDLLAPIKGDVLVLLDACHSGALIGHGADALPVHVPENVHVITSSLGNESAWYYDHRRLSSGAISYFSQAFCTGLGLFGHLEADTDGDDAVSLWEISSWIRQNVASSTCQVLSSSLHTLLLPVCTDSTRSKPVEGFFCGSQLISSVNTDFRFSFYVTREAQIEYRLTPFENGNWNWGSPIVIRDSETTAETGRGTKTRTLTISPENRNSTPYLIFQIFAYEDSVPVLCGERLLAMQPDNASASLTLSVSPSFNLPAEIPLALTITPPSIYRISIYDETDSEIRRLHFGELTRPSSENVQYLIWDGRDDSGALVSEGSYTIEIISLFNGRRLQISQDVHLRRR